MELKELEKHVIDYIETKTGMLCNGFVLSYSATDGELHNISYTTGTFTTYPTAIGLLEISKQMILTPDNEDEE